MVQALLPFPHIDPVALHIWGPLVIRWYALAYIAGIVLAWWGVARTLRQKQLWAPPPFNGNEISKPRSSTISTRRRR